MRAHDAPNDVVGDGEVVGGVVEVDAHLQVEPVVANVVYEVVVVHVIAAGAPGFQRARVLAVLNQRDFVTPDDIKAMSKPVLSHRLILRPEYEIEGIRVEEVIDEILKKCEIPR